ncbi:MAG: hypothetical protein K2P87_01650 [Lachnospiraceae bacterium]|nr:hypothetical protein [Lachnospiraceae bacterium]
MAARMDYHEALRVISEALGRMPGELNGRAVKVMTQLERRVKRNAQKVLSKHRTKIERAGYTHMADDVVGFVENDKAGNVAVLVKGGNRTYRKWHLLDDGTSKAAPVHFIDETLRMSDADIERAVEELTERYTGDEG